MVCVGKRALLQCNPGKRVKVTQARWGADSSVACANSTYPGAVSLPLTSNTDSSQVTDQIRKRCAKQQNCEVEASGSFFDEGASSVPSEAKYLKMWHECIPDVSEVILPSRRAKRDARVQKREFRFPQPSGTGPELLKSYGESLGTSGSLNSSRGGVGQSFFGGKSNKQITPNRNDSVTGKEKRSETDRGNANFARVLDDLLAPSSLNK